MVRASNTVTGFVNFTTFMLSIPILASGIWPSSSANETDCLRFLQWPIIVVGAAIMAISFMGFARSPESVQMFFLRRLKPIQIPQLYLTSSRPAPSAATTTTSSSGGYSADEASHTTCTICMTKVSTCATLRVSECSHRHCFPCMKKHVEFKLLNEAGPPRCPHAGCSSVLNSRYFKGVLRPRLLGVMKDRLKESAVVEGDRVYCPVPSCSALMSRSSLIRKAKPNDKYPKSRVSCVQCKKHFCLYCKRSCSGRSSEHSCSEEERKNPLMSSELQELAKEKNWRRCVKCNHMIELLVGCYQVTCRCGHEFCCKCGASRISKSETGFMSFMERGQHCLLSSCNYWELIVVIEQIKVMMLYFFVKFQKART